MATPEKPTEAQNQAPEVETETPEESPELTGVVFDEDESDASDDDAPPADDAPADEAPPETPGEPDDTPPEGKEGEKPVNQESVEKKINKLTFEKHEERRKREAAEQRIVDLEKKIQESAAESADIVVPEMPDPLDAEYDDKLAARETAIRQLGEAEARKKLAQEQQDRAYQEAIEAQQKEIQGHVDTMFATGETLGIKKDKLIEADKRVADFVKDSGVAKYIISHKDAPLLVTYLAASAESLEKLGRLDPISATEFLLTSVMPEAAKLRPGITNTPPPMDVPEGRGGAETPNPYLKGVTME
jgi:hypothetical protein